MTRKEALDGLAKCLGIDPETQAILDACSTHPYTCRCETCRRWWKSVGPQNEDGTDFGPFTKEEVERP